MGLRTKARECAFQMLYQWELTRQPMEEVAAAFWRLRSTLDRTRVRAEELARGTQADLSQIDEAIAAASLHWRPDRMAAVDRAVLRLATYELLREAQTPGPVILDEAVELAKRFGEADSPAFVNGVLDAVMRKLRGQGSSGG